tara:strand:+ start:347 stop:493 length:147 start_codon:yes stop_codon:yes gene_type:complete
MIKGYFSPYKYTELYKNIPGEHDSVVNVERTSFWGSIEPVCIELNLCF